MRCYRAVEEGNALGSNTSSLNKLLILNNPRWVISKHPLNACCDRQLATNTSISYLCFVARVRHVTSSAENIYPTGHQSPATCDQISGSLWVRLTHSGCYKRKSKYFLWVPPYLLLYCSPYIVVIRRVDRQMTFPWGQLVTLKLAVKIPNLVWKLNWTSIWFSDLLTYYRRLQFAYKIFFAHIMLITASNAIVVHTA